MLSWLQNLSEKWKNWCGDRDLEIAIRRHLTQDGYYGGMAKLMNVRLVAVQRPGWVQVYQFDAQARISPMDDSLSDDQVDRAPAEYIHLFGLVREDVRKSSPQVRTFVSSAERSELLCEWSEGLIRRGR